MTVSASVARESTAATLRIAANLGAVPRALRPRVRAALAKSGNTLADQARGNAGWSRRIPRSIVVKPVFRSGREGVEVRARSSVAPHARPYEGIGGSGSFRHPVFGRSDRTRSQWTWVPQSTRPFLRPAQEAAGPQALRDADEAVQAALRAAGL